MPWLNITEKLVIAVIIAIALYVVDSGDLQLLVAFSYICAISILGFLWFKFTASDSVAAEYLPKLFLVAFGVRAAAAVAIQMFVKQYVAYDAPTYEDFGMQWSNFWNRTSVAPPHEYLPSLHLYSQIVGVQYFLSGNDSYIPQLTNSLIGALIPSIVYGIGRRALGGENTGRTAAVFAALNMACIIWSAIAMRDIIIIYFVTLTLSDSIMIAKRLEVSKLLRLAVWLGIIYVFRPYATLILICSIGITFALQPKKPILRFLIGCLFAGLLIGVIVVGGVQAIALEVIQSQTDQLNNARSIITYQTSHDQGYAPDVQYETPIDIVKFIPAGLFYFWAGPLPFGYGAREFIFAIPEIVSWYVTFWYGFRGFLYLRGSKKTLVPLLIFFLLGSFLLSAICGNYAEAIRLRSMLSAPLQLAAGIGWTYRRKRMLDMAGAA